MQINTNGNKKGKLITVDDRLKANNNLYLYSLRRFRVPK